MIIKCKNRNEWLEERSKLDVNASNAAAILGWDPRRTALDAYVQKKIGDTLDDNDALMLGRVMEPGIAEAYAKKTGRNVFDPGNYTIWIHDDLPWIGATLDRLTWKTTEEETSPDITGDGFTACYGSPLQLKHAGWMKRKEWLGEPPLWLQIQLQIEIACSHTSWGAYCAVVGGIDIHYGDLDVNENFFESSVKVFEEFRWRLKKNTPPMVETPKNLSSVKLLYPNDNGETMQLGDDDQQLADRLMILKSAIKESEDEKDEIEAKLKLKIGESTFGELPNGKIISLKTIKRKGYTKKVEAGTYRKLSISNG